MDLVHLTKNVFGLDQLAGTGFCLHWSHGGPGFLGQVSPETVHAELLVASAVIVVEHLAHVKPVMCQSLLAGRSQTRRRRRGRW